MCRQAVADCVLKQYALEQHKWEMLCLIEVSTKCRETVGYEGDAQFCCSAALYLAANAETEQIMILSELLYLILCTPN